MKAGCVSQSLNSRACQVKLAMAASAIATGAAQRRAGHLLVGGYLSNARDDTADSADSVGDGGMAAPF